MFENLEGNATLPPKPSEDRRVDSEVREAICSLEKYLHDPEAINFLFAHALESIKRLSDSDCASCFTNDLEIADSLFPVIDNSLIEISRARQNSFVLKAQASHWVNEKLMPNCACYFNKPIPKSHRRLINQSCEVNALMMMPFLYGNKLKAMFVFASKKGVYSANILRRVEPILESLAYVLSTAYQVRQPLIGWHDEFLSHEFVNSMLTASPIITLACDDKDNIVMANPSAIEVLSVPDRELSDIVGINVNQILPSYKSLFQWSHSYKNSNAKMTNVGATSSKEQLVHKRDGSGFLANVSFFQYEAKARKFVVLQIQNVTKLKEQAKKRQVNDQQLSALTHLIPVAVVNIDSSWNCKYSNDKWHDFTGLTREETVDKGWVNGFHNEDVQGLLEDLRKTLKTGRDYQKELRLVSLFGSIKWVDFNAKVLFNENGTVLGFIGTFQDITDRILQQDKLTQLAQYDGLTGLTNRSLFQDRLQQAFFHSQRENDEITVMFLDLDGFKDINDSLGHDVGDLLLCEVAKRLINTLRRNDTVARFGGDEFVILLGLNEHQNIVIGVAEKIIKSISEPFTINESEIFVTVSVGIATGTFKNSSSKQILKNADSALYEAKREGKNNYQMFNAAIDSKSQNRVTLANQLRYALQEEQYNLFFQPIANVATNQIIGCEALLRYQHTDGTTETSSTLISVLEDTGMIIDVGKWVIEQTCKQLSEWQQSGTFPETGFVSFNVSAKQLLDHNIVELIKEACNKYKTDPSGLVMELTETVFIRKPEHVEKVLVALKKLGIKIALDDFGTGYSSLSYLQKFPFDHIKIDRSFVENLYIDENNAKITKTIVLLAQSLNMKVIAEGVTTDECRLKLAEYGANYYQGYVLGRPAPANSLTETLKSN